MKGVLVYVGALILVLAGLVWGGPAKSDTAVYSWTTRFGTICFSDDESKIPQTYKHNSSLRRVDGLNSYPKFTPMGTETATEE